MSGWMKWDRLLCRLSPGRRFEYNVGNSVVVCGDGGGVVSTCVRACARVHILCS